MDNRLVHLALFLALGRSACAATVVADDEQALRRPHPSGTTLLLRRGHIYQGPIVFSSSGTAAAPIRITAAAGAGSAPVIKGLSRLYTDALTITGSYVVIEGLAFADTNRAAVQVTKSASHVTVSGNEMTQVGFGVSVLGHDVVVSRNFMHDLTMVRNTPVDESSPQAKAATSNDDYGATGVIVSGSHVEIANNRFVRAKAASFDYGTDGGAVEIFASGVVEDVDVHDNWAEACDGFLEGGGQKGAMVSDVRLARNVSLDSGPFLVLHNGGGFGVRWTAFRAHGNTVVNETSGPKDKAAVFLDHPNASGVEIDHNIFWLNDGDSVWKQNASGYHHDNVFYLATPKNTHLFNNWSMDLAPGEKIADPLFADRARRNFALKPGSPAAGAGAFAR